MPSRPSSKRNSRYRTLVVEHDGYWLTAAIVRGDGAWTWIESTSVSNSADPRVALAEALVGLDNRRLPRVALLLVPGAVQAVAGSLMEDNAAHDGETQELIQLELEARLSEQIGTRTFEEIAVERGHLSFAEVAVARAEMERRRHESRRAAGAGSLALGFSDVALSLKLLDRSAVQECQMIEERFRFEQMNNANVDWTAKPLPLSPSRPQASWLVTGVGCMLRDQWVAAFNGHGIELAAIYPIAGNAATVVDDIERVPNAAIVEIHAGLIGVSRVARGQLMGVELRYLSGDAPTVATILELVPSGVDAIWLAGGFSGMTELCDALNDAMSIDVLIVPVHGIGNEKNDKDANLFRYAHLVGAHRHWHGLAPNLLTSCIRTAEIAQSSRKRNWLPALAAAALIAAALGATGGYQILRLQSAQQAIAASANRLRGLHANERDDGELAKHIEALTWQINEADQQLTDMRRRRQFVADELPRRGELPLVLLDAVANSASPMVVVDHIEDQDWTTIRVSGWALSQVDAERFADALSTELRPWHLELIETPVIQEQPGRLGLAGYGFELCFGFQDRHPKQQDDAQDQVAEPQQDRPLRISQYSNP